MEENSNRAEAERLLGIADKLLQGKDLNGSRDFAILAQETEPLLEGSDQIVAVADVLLAAEKRINNHHDWYAILQLDRGSDDLELIKKQYRRLALLLHPDKNKFAFADTAFKIVAGAWAVLSDPGKKSLFDNELSLFSRIDLVAFRNQKGHHHQQQFREQQEQHQQQKFPVRRTSQAAAANSGAKKRSDEARLSSFWTACPYCYNLFEYPRVYEGCCLRCQNCERSFHAAQIPSLPPMVPGKEAYYCCWGLFPLGFMNSNSEAAVPDNGGGAEGGNGFVDVPEGNVNPRPVTKKRGRPSKNVQVY
uniref:J domain-containing protein n=1 Tax=Davidia involucrata TaxID=16924 RepID=A0A5B6YSX0_DAVIN